MATYSSEVAWLLQIAFLDEVFTYGSDARWGLT
jgi:hypothetical protein